MEASIPKHVRWIPSGMTVKYLKIARSNLKATCSLDIDTLNKTGDYLLNIDVIDDKGEIVFNAAISLYLSEKKKKD